MPVAPIIADNSDENPAIEQPTANNAQQSANSEEEEPRFVILRADDDRLEEPKGAKVRKPKPPAKYTAKIKAAKYTGYQILLIKLDNGEIWKQLAPARRQRLPAAGDPVEVKRTPLGAWTISINGRAGVKMQLMNG